MKTKLLILFALASNHFIFSQKIEKMNRVDVEGFYTNPVVSPNGKFALVTGHHYKGAYVLNLRNIL